MPDPKRVKAGRTAKQRGRNNEYIIAEYGNRLGLDVSFKRRPLSGSLRDAKLDIVVKQNGEEVERFEAKYHKDGDGFKSLFDLLFNNLDVADGWSIKDGTLVILDYCTYLEIKYKKLIRPLTIAHHESKKDYKTITDWVEKAREQGGTGVVCRMFRSRSAMLIIPREVLIDALEAV